MKYRSDIDGLRAVAVSAVVLYHANLLGLSGGFVGVDIFFVISGYLITSILRDEIARGEYSLLRFYDRRIRRIVPAYVVVMVATTLAALFILPPEELADYGQRLASTASFLSNFYFRRETDYFARSALDNPLLHTWSLSVEEQFYVVWPVLMSIIAAPILVRWRRSVVVFGLVASFLCACYFAFAKPITAFFYSPFRAWELLLGAAVALQLAPRLSDKWTEWSAAAGFALIVAPIFLLDDTVPFPGATALPPCLGAAMILHAGQHRLTAIGKLLSLKLLIGIGLISYSLYLWHWPLLSLGRLALGHELSRVESLLLVGLAVGLSIFSWRYIEMTFRKRRAAPAAFPISVPVGVVSLVILGVTGLSLHYLDGLPFRSNPGAQLAASERNQRSQSGRGCQLTNKQTRLPTDRKCLLGNDGAPVGVLLGDSHATAYSSAIDLLGRDLGFTLWQWTKTSCAPVLSESSDTSLQRWIADDSSSSCNAFREKAVQALSADPQLRVVVISGFWSALQDDAIANAKRQAAGPDAQRRLTQGLERMVDVLSSQGKTVILLGDPPVFPSGGGDCVIRQRFLKRDDSSNCRVAQSYVQALLTPSNMILESLTRKYSNVYFFRASHQFCRGDWCYPALDGQVLMRDEHHLNYLGSRKLAATMGAVFSAGLSSIQRAGGAD